MCFALVVMIPSCQLVRADVTACTDPEGPTAVPDFRHTTRQTKTVGASVCRTSHRSLKYGNLKGSLKFAGCRVVAPVRGYPGE